MSARKNLNAEDKDGKKDERREKNASRKGAKNAKEERQWKQAFHENEQFVGLHRGGVEGRGNGVFTPYLRGGV